jgi:regulator of protease activity HflC (stomatin/prohibitin superfamily)
MWVAIIFAILAIAAALLSLALNGTSRDEAAQRAAVRGVAAVLGGLAVLMVVVSSPVVVSTQAIGVETNFGRPTGDLGDGLHFKAPWDNVTEMDGAIQTTTDAGADCLSVRIGGQQTACVDITIQWRIRPRAADALYRSYHSFSDVRAALVDRELEQAVNQQLAGYSPIADLAASGTSGTTEWTGFSGQIAAQMRREIGAQIDVLKVIMPYVTYDQATQARLNSLQQQIASTLIAQQAVHTAQQESAANKELAASVSHDPDVLVSRCLDLLSQMIKQGQAVPAGFSCWPGGSAAAVIANGSSGSGG